MRTYDDPSQTKMKKKLVVVGDGACGKTALLMVQGGNPFPEVNAFDSRIMYRPFLKITMHP